MEFWYNTQDVLMFHIQATSRYKTVSPEHALSSKTGQEKMTERKQGRRSAQTAAETKYQILMAATDMFCELGYERVSLRNISERAGVSHSLIRHHFGSKEKIWYTINDKLHEYMEHYMVELLKQIPQGSPPNETLYLFSVKMLAHLLLVPKPIQFIADGIRQEGEFFDYFVDQKGKVEKLFHELTDNFNKAFPDKQINLWEQKWLLISTGYTAIGLKPMLKAIWTEHAQDPARCLLNHWELYNQYTAHMYCIPDNKVIHPEDLEELLLPMAACWKKCKSAEEIAQIYSEAAEGANK